MIFPEIFFDIFKFECQSLYPIFPAKCTPCININLSLCSQFFSHNARYIKLIADRTVTRGRVLHVGDLIPNEKGRFLLFYDSSLGTLVKCISFCANKIVISFLLQKGQDNE